MKPSSGRVQSKSRPGDRVTTLLSGRKPDRVPFFPLGVRSFAAVNLGHSIGSSYSDSEMNLEDQLLTQEQYGFDGFPYYAYGTYGVWEFGGETKFPSGEFQMAPSAVRFPVETEEDVWKMELPDVRTAGAIPIAMSFSRAAEKAGVWVTTPTAGGVFTTAANIPGIQRMCRWMLRKPELAHRLLRLATDHVVEVTQYWVDTFGPDIIAYTAEPSAANQIISPKHFEEFVLPYTVEFHRKILDMGIRHVMCHICGEQNSNLPYWARVPMGDPGIVTFGHEVDLSTAIEKAKHAPCGFILMSGCGFPPKAPPYNVYVMEKAVEELGWYD